MSEENKQRLKNTMKMIVKQKNQHEIFYLFLLYKNGKELLAFGEKCIVKD